MQGFLGGFKAACGVETRRKLESDIERAKFFRRLRDLFKATSPGRRVCSTVPILRRLKSGFSPMSGTKSAIVRAQPNPAALQSNSAAPGKPVSRPRLTIA